jgi:hypothetical protein
MGIVESRRGYAGAPVDECAASPSQLSYFPGIGPCGYAADNLERLSIPLQLPVSQREMLMPINRRGRPTKNRRRGRISTSAFEPHNGLKSDIAPCPKSAPKGDIAATQKRGLFTITGKSLYGTDAPVEDRICVLFIGQTCTRLQTSPFAISRRRCLQRSKKSVCHMLATASGSKDERPTLTS